MEILLQQFKKFITPSVPQQEERIQEISDLAQHLYGEVSFKIPTDSLLNTSLVNLIQQKAEHGKPSGSLLRQPIQGKG